MVDVFLILAREYKGIVEGIENLAVLVVKGVMSGRSLKACIGLDAVF